MKKTVGKKSFGNVLKKVGGSSEFLRRFKLDLLLIHVLFT